MIDRSKAILDHLLSGRSLTQGEAVALGYGPQPIAATIFKLRADGHNIITRNKRDIHNVRYAEYALVVRNRFGEKVA